MSALQDASVNTYYQPQHYGSHRYLGAEACQDNVPVIADVLAEDHAYQKTNYSCADHHVDILEVSKRKNDRNDDEEYERNQRHRGSAPKF